MNKNTFFRFLKTVFLSYEFRSFFSHLMTFGAGFLVGCLFAAHVISSEIQRLGL